MPTITSMVYDIDEGVAIFMIEGKSYGEPVGFHPDRRRPERMTRKQAQAEATKLGVPFEVL